MSSVITGLKIENDVVYSMNEKTAQWEQAASSSICEIEGLIGRIQAQSFPSKTIRENFIFENEYDVGTGSVRTFKDERGELTYTYHQESKKNVDIDEDAAFGFESAVSHSKKTDLPAKEVVNFWGATSKSKHASDKEPKKAEARNTKTDELNVDLTGRRKQASSVGLSEKVKDLQLDPLQIVKKRKRVVEDVSSSKPSESIQESTVKTATFVAKKNVASSARDCFQKRPFKEKKDQASVLRNNMKRLFLKFKYISKKDSFPSSDTEKVKDQILTYISSGKTNVKSRQEPSLLIASLRYDRKKNIKNTLQSKFYIEPIQEKNSDSDSFDNLIESIVGTDK